jgi:ketosteroid isomerase-like protein
MRPRELFEQMQQQWWFGRPGALTGDLLAHDVVVETPFAAPGRPTRIEGRQRWLDHVNPQRVAFPVRFEGCHTRAVHDTADPDTIVVEYELTARHADTGRRATAAFIGVLTARDGKIALWREYQNTPAIQAAPQPSADA